MTPTLKMRYINRRFTYLLTYLLMNIRTVQRMRLAHRQLQGQATDAAP